MALELSDFYALQDGYRDPIVVGVLPDNIRERLGLRLANVYLSRDSFNHIMEKHAPSLFDLLLCPIIIERGLLIQERNKNVIVASYEDKETKRRYCAAMKIIAKDCEIWLSSFYRMRPRQTRSLLKRGNILRRHKKN